MVKHAEVLLHELVVLMQLGLSVHVVGLRHPFVLGPFVVLNEPPKDAGLHVDVNEQETDHVAKVQNGFLLHSDV